ncbi:hypothetical protein LCGC14_2653390, partial [marine sediment metagenome]
YFRLSLCELSLLRLILNERESSDESLCATSASRGCSGPNSHSQREANLCDWAFR